MLTASFDTIAPVYDPLARLVFGRSIVQAQTCFLDTVPPGARVLIIGGGTGWILTELLQKQAIAHIDYVEASARMISLAQQKYRNFKKKHAISHSATVKFIQGTEHNVPSETLYDVIITFFVLDMYHNEALRNITQKLYDKLISGGIWLFADFKTNQKRVQRWWHQALVNLMFLFFRLTCNLQNRKLPDYDQAFSQLPLFREKTKTFFRQLMVSEVYRKC